MNASGLAPELVKAFERVTVLYGLNDGEKQFVLRVFSRFTALTMETREEMVRAFGHFPQTDSERIMAAIGFSIFYAKPLEEELLIGLQNYSRQDLILEALRAIVVLAFPRKAAVHMLDAFN